MSKTRWEIQERFDGKFDVMEGDKVVGTYDTYEEAKKVVDDHNREGGAKRANLVALALFAFVACGKAPETPADPPFGQGVATYQVRDHLNRVNREIKISPIDDTHFTATYVGYWYFRNALESSLTNTTVRTVTMSGTKTTAGFKYYYESSPSNFCEIYEYNTDTKILYTHDPAASIDSIGCSTQLSHSSEYKRAE